MGKGDTDRDQEIILKILEVLDSMLIIISQDSC